MNDNIFSFARKIMNHTPLQPSADIGATSMAIAYDMTKAWSIDAKDDKDLEQKLLERAKLIHRLVLLVRYGKESEK